MTKKVIPRRKKLAAIFASFTILIMGALSLSESMSLDYYSVLDTLQKVIPSSIILGSIGWVMGLILDRPAKRSSGGYSNLFLNEMINSDISNTEELQTENAEGE